MRLLANAIATITMRREAGDHSTWVRIFDDSTNRVLLETDCSEWGAQRVTIVIEASGEWSVKLGSAPAQPGEDS
jgi:hypothetical protein